MNKPQPRPHYAFETMELDEVKHYNDAEFDGAKVLSAAYAYGRRRGKKFCGATQVLDGVRVMSIRMYK